MFRRGVSPLDANRTCHWHGELVALVCRCCRVVTINIKIYKIKYNYCNKITNYSHMATLIACLDERCAASPARRLFTWLDDRGEQQDSLTYGDVDARTRTLAARLVEGTCTGGCALARGDRTLLVFEPCLSFVIAFLACLSARA